MSEATKARPDYLAKGSRIGEYEIVDHVAAGSTGALYEVRRDGKRFALKIGRQRLGGLVDDDRVQVEGRIDREVAALASLRHPNIVRVHSFERWPDLEGYPYLVMDYVEGSTLFEWRISAAPSLARICNVFEKIASALAQMHEVGLCHRDLKGENVLVRAGDEPVIVDFGIARPRVSYTVTRFANVGTITHLSPEYAAYCDSAAFRRGEPFEWRPSGDMHSLGYMLCEVLTGRPPFPRGEGPSAGDDSFILYNIKNFTPKPLSASNPRVPKPLDEVAACLLEKDPSLRPGAREVEKLLAAARQAAVAAGDRSWDGPFDVSGALPQTPAAPAKNMGGDGQRPDLPAVAREPVFDDGRGSATAGKGSAPKDGELPNSIREAKEKVRASAPRWRPGPVFIAAGALVLLVTGFLAAALMSTPPPPASRTLLSQADQRAGTSAPATAPPTVAHPPVAGLGPADQAGGTGDATRLREGHPSAASPPREPGAGKHRSPIRRSMDAGDRRPGAAAELPLVPSVEPGHDPWLKRSQSLATASPVSQAKAEPPKPRGVPFGSHIRSRLLTNLDTRTIGAGPVEAMILSPFVVRGEVRLPARTLAYGVASESSGRFTVRFTRLRLPDDTEVAIEAIAFDREEGKPGLAPSRRIGSEPTAQPGVATRVAKGTGNILLDTITGGTTQDIARNAGQTVLNHEEQLHGGGQSAVLLDAGVVFDIWVEKAF